ncbi:hypothetical protein MGU_11253 [Metarhizium guizhouense ARSEF 977]|uniref:Uncharacterized protein n=1 Tax=Metarhizium guizhouense (strain ARSEF 977) TaxID=1276136 RepID=A0A0B4GFY2_METGA|nr:hypothetical protein MGU_11253 [Metarhizium guizhouense ARSEF 977]
MSPYKPLLVSLETRYFNGLAVEIPETVLPLKDTVIKFSSADLLTWPSFTTILFDHLRPLPPAIDLTNRDLWSLSYASSFSGKKIVTVSNTDKVIEGIGAACWDCAKDGHTCKPVPPGARAAVRAFWVLNRRRSGADDDPDDAWRAAAQRAAQQLPAWGNGAASPATPGQVPALASFGEIAEKGLEERNVVALETIAEALDEAVKLWIRLTQRDEEEEEEEEEEED